MTMVEKGKHRGEILERLLSVYAVVRLEPGIFRVVKLKKDMSTILEHLEQTYNYLSSQLLLKKKAMVYVSYNEILGISDTLSITELFNKLMTEDNEDLPFNSEFGKSRIRTSLCLGDSEDDDLLMLELDIGEKYVGMMYNPREKTLSFDGLTRNKTMMFIGESYKDMFNRDYEFFRMDNFKELGEKNPLAESIYFILKQYVLSDFARLYDIIRESFCVYAGEEREEDEEYDYI